MTSVGTLLFDGDCGFCTWSVTQARRWLRPTARIVAWQQANLDELNVSAEECSQAVQFVRPNLTHVPAGLAVAELLKSSRQPWPVVGSCMSLPGLLTATNAVYRLVARNRYRLPGSTPACQLPMRPDVESAA